MQPAQSLPNIPCAQPPRVRSPQSRLHHLQHPPAQVPGLQEGQFQQGQQLLMETQSVAVQPLPRLQAPQECSEEMMDLENYYIDTLKDEFCQVNNDGWYQIIQPLNQEDLATVKEERSSDAEMKSSDEPSDSSMTLGLEKSTSLLGQQLATDVAASQEETLDPKIERNLDPSKYGTGKWTDEEHVLFLEALRIFGKDWEAIQGHVKVRDLPNIRSHAQKFLAKLVRFVKDGKPVKKMSREEMFYYYGILNRKVHKTTKSQIKKIQKAEQEGQIKQIFSISREQHATAPLQPLGNEALGAHGERKSQFDKWKETYSQGSHSLGHSVKGMKVVEQQQDGGSSKSFKLSFRLQGANVKQEPTVGVSEEVQEDFKFAKEENSIVFNTYGLENGSMMLQFLATTEEISEKDADGKYHLQVSELEVYYMLQRVNKDNYIDFLTVFNDQKTKMEKPNVMKAMQDCLLLWMEFDNPRFHEFVPRFRQKFTFLNESGNLLPQDRIIQSLLQHKAETLEDIFGQQYQLDDQH